MPSAEPVAMGRTSLWMGSKRPNFREEEPLLMIRMGLIAMTGSLRRKFLRRLDAHVIANVGGALCTVVTHS
jgi:hypothetical protein